LQSQAAATGEETRAVGRLSTSAGAGEEPPRQATVPATVPATILERRCKSLPVSATLACAGAYLDGFTYVGHGHVFANAMTGNVVLLGVDAISGSWRRCLSHLLPILMFLMGIGCARLGLLPGIRRWLQHPELAVLGIEITVLFSLGCLPPWTANFVITMSIAFAASLQMATFRDINGRSYSSTFTTGNLRTMIENSFDWLFLGHQRKHLDAAREFATICSMFLVGASLGALATPKLHNHALWIDVAVLCCVMAWLLDGANRRAHD
jgi:uncharacterized membrane protein YoaK (UPF0700 family)